MDAMLTGSVKEDRRAELGVSLGIDISKLDVCFGGFAPTVMGDMTLTWNKAVEVETRLAERKQAALRAAQLDVARESEPLEWADDTGSVWKYVLLDGADVRIKGCRPHASTLCVPASIEGRAVVELAPECCARLSGVTGIIVPDSVVAIGDCAFRGCSELEHVVLPAFVAGYHADWFRYCNELKSLKLPGALEVITPRIFDHGHLEELVIGASTRDVQPGAFIKSVLKSISVDPENPFMTSDGHALYSKDLQIMAALATPLRSYRVVDDCKVVGKKAFSSCAQLEEVELPDSIEVIGEFSFANTAIKEFKAPKGLKAILEKAFYNCAHLEALSLNHGLELIGASAFADTGISALGIPATVTQIGPGIADGTKVVFAGEDATFTICYDNETLLADVGGGLYECTDEGTSFVRLLDASASSYEVIAGVASIGAHAFENAPALETVTLPEGIKEIGAASFSGCHSLKAVNIPRSVRDIGEGAFLDTSLEQIDLPAHLRHLGDRALITQGAHHGKMDPSLRHVAVEERSERFRMHEGMLLERKDDGAERVVVYVGPDEVVHIPDTVDEICAYAFNGTTSIQELFLSDRIGVVGVRGLAVDAPLEHIHIDLVEAHEGHECFDIWPPHTDRAEQQMMLALTVPTFVNVEALFEHYDNSIINASSFDAMSERGLDEYERAIRLIERLEDPVYMGPVSQDMAYRTLRERTNEIALEMGRHDDRDSLRRLADLSILTSENIDDVIASVQRTQDASITGYLLELKRERFGRRSFDFSL